MFSSLLIELELYGIVIGLSIAIFVFMARERLRSLREDPSVDEQPLVKGKHGIANPFTSPGSTF